MKTFVKMECGNCGHTVTRDPSPMWGGGPHCPNCGADLTKRKLTQRALDAAHAEGCGCFECVYGKREPLVLVITPRQ